MQDKVGNPFALKKNAAFIIIFFVRKLFKNRVFFIYEKMQLINNKSEKNIF